MARRRGPARHHLPATADPGTLAPATVATGVIALAVVSVGTVPGFAVPRAATGTVAVRRTTRTVTVGSGAALRK